MLVELVLVIALVAILSLRFSAVQTYLAQSVTEKLSKDLNTTINIGKVDIHPFSKISLENVIALDLFNDTVINTGLIDIAINDINIDSNNINIESVALNQADIKLIKPKGQRGFSFQFIIDHFANDDEKQSNGSESFTITGNRVELINSNFYFIDHRAKAKYYGMDFTNLAFQNIDITISDFKNKGSNIKANIEHLSTKEKSKFDIRKLTGIVEIDSNFAQIDSLKVITEYSNIKTRFFRFEFDSPEDFEDDFENKVTMIGDFTSSSLNLKDLNYFSSFFEGIDRSVLFSGKFKGLVSDFKTTNFYLKLDNNTYYKGDLAMKGLPYTDNTTFKANVKEFKTNEYELEGIDIPPFVNNKKLKLPKELKGIGDIVLSGNIEGKFDDVNAKIFTQTAFGKVDTDSRYWFNEKLNKSIFKGSVVTKNFDAGKFVNDKNISGLDANLQTNFVWDSKNGYDASVKGGVSSLVFKDYHYKNININGTFNDYFFSGKADINDKNISLSFDGLINYEDSIPRFNFKSNIDNLNLKELNLTNDSVERIIKGDITINGEGTDADDANGYAIIKNLSYLQDGKSYNSDEIEIVASPKDSGRIINVTSSIIDATIDGDFKIKGLGKSFKYIASKTLPALYNDTSLVEVYNQQISFFGKIKDYSPIEELFTPSVSIAPNTVFKGDFNAINAIYNITAISDSVFIDERKVEGINVSINKPDDVVDVRVTFDRANINSDTYFDNVVFKSLLKENLINPSIKWRSNDGSSYGYIQGNGYWYDADYFDFLILPSYVHFNNRDWHNKEDASFIMDGKDFIFNGLEAKNNEGEVISVVGTISENPKEELHIYLDDFKIENLNTLLGSEKVKYYGIVNGSSCITNIYNEGLIESDFYIDTLKANDEVIGSVALNANWISSSKGIECKGELLREDRNAFDFIGTYYPFNEENALDFNCVLDETPLSFLNTFIEGEGVSEIDGFASGNVRVKGMPNKPLLNGAVNFDYAGFKIDYLNTYYDFSGEIDIIEDGILTNNNILMRDMTDNIALFNGAIFHNNFSDFDFDISINIPEKIWAKGYDKRNKEFSGAQEIDNKFYCLNTTEQLNEEFYGNVYAIGDVNISGYQENIDITVDAKTMKGTKFTLPLNGSSNVKLEDYIVFVDSNTVLDEKETINLEGINLDLTVEATPESELEIIFDEVYGDIMRGKGSGILNMTVDKNNEFNMKGKYTIEEGDYLFTLGLLNFENIVNKKFQVANGSTISWFGDPYNAEVDINAIYKLKASYYDIMLAYSEEVKSRYKNRADVECYMNLTQSLMQPNINFEVELPRADETVKTALANLIQTKQELNKQVFSLLILNRFLPPVNSISNEGREGTGALSSTASELLSNQLSNWLSKSFDNIDVGLNYRPGDNITNDELAVALSTELLKDRLVISSNFGSTLTNNNNSTNPFVGDVNVEYKLNKDGTFRIRAFSRINEYDITNTNQANTTQGAGVYFKKEFNSLKDFKWQKKKGKH